MDVASIAGRGLIFMTVGVLFRLFGAPIKAFIDRYLGMLTTAFVLLLVGGFVVASYVGTSEGDTTRDKCQMQAPAAA